MASVCKTRLVILRNITNSDMHCLMHDIGTIDDLVRALGGPSALGEFLGISQEAVSNWKARQDIPPGWHLRLFVELQRRGKSVDPRVFGLRGSEAEVLSRVRCRHDRGASASA